MPPDRNVGDDQRWITHREMTVRETGHDHPFDRLSVERARSGQLPPEEVDRLAEVLTVLSEPVRVRVVLALLSVEELCVSDIALAAQIGESAASYALRVLRMAGIVERRRDGRMSFYRLASNIQPALRPAFTALRRLTATTLPRR